MKHLLSIVGAATLVHSLIHADSVPQAKSNALLAPDIRPDDGNYSLREGFFLDADFLYWIAHEEALEYAGTGTFGDGNSVPDTPVKQGSSKSVDFKWKPGFRLGAGWTLPHHYWDLSATWTWYRSEARGSASHSGDPTINPLWPMAPTSVDDLVASPLTLDSASAKWHLLYNTLDVELGRAFYPNKHLLLRPHGGIRGAWINQRYSNLFNFDNGDDSLSTTTRKFHSNYHAAGFKAGLDTLWSFKRYWGIFANGSISLLGGNFHLHERDALTSIINTGALVFAGDFVFIDTKDRFFSILPAFETSMGVHFALKPEHKKYEFDFDVAWEYQFWLNQNQIPVFTSNHLRGLFSRERANLHLMGLTLHAKFHF